MIPERISDDIPPQMKILNMVIPILIICSLKKTMKMYFVAPIRPATASYIEPLPAAYIHLSANENFEYSYPLSELPCELTISVF